MSTDSASFRTAEQYVYLHLRERILTGDLPGGTRINPVEVAAELTLSRMPVREALRQLDAEGLVTIRPNRRAIVTSLTVAEVDELFEMRAVLEALAVRFAVSNLTPEAMRELELMHEFMNEAQFEPKTWIQRHAEFHDFIVELSGRNHLRTQLTRIRNAIQPYLLMYASVYQNTERARYEHDALIAAIRSRDPSTAEASMLDHVRTTAKGLFDFLSQREKRKTSTDKPDSGAVASRAARSRRLARK